MEEQGRERFSFAGTDGDAARHALERSRGFHAGEIAGEMARVLGKDTGELMEILAMAGDKSRRADAMSFNDPFDTVEHKLDEFEAKAKSIDTALASLHGTNSEAAREAFEGAQCIARCNRFSELSAPSPRRRYANADSRMLPVRPRHRCEGGDFLPRIEIDEPDFSGDRLLERRR